jgi:hypothetical protein
MRQRSLASRTSSTSAVSSGRLASQCLTGSGWSLGHSASSQRTSSSPPAAARRSFTPAGRTRRTTNREWLITTNDNLDALRFYQRRAFASDLR